MVRHPIYMIHLVYPIGLGVIYLVFSIVYYFAGGTDYRGMRYIYDVLYWGNPGRAASIAAGIFVLLIFLHVFAWILHKLRMRLFKKIYKEVTVIKPQENA